jgi:outer membrane protein OmpA-like peptidoglycan-associated protein
MKKVSITGAFAALLSLVLIGSALAQNTTTNPQQTAVTSTRKTEVAPGMKMKVKGVVVRRDGDTLLVRDQMGSDLSVQVTPNTKIEERKSNPFRSAKKFADAQLTRGLNAEFEGRGGAGGALVAEKIKFSDDDLRVASTIESQVVPIENRIGESETRITRAEQNAERLSGQVEELGQVANLAKGGARAAQETADAAVEGVNRTNDRINTLDEYDVQKSASIMFRVGSAILSPEAKTTLDEIATQAKTEKGFVIEVRGFASSDGSEQLNRALSQRRADAVVRYLAETHDISLRRIVLPFGYGEALPVADNTTREGRQENRRVEVKILVSKGMTTPVNVTRSVSTNR